MQPGAWPGLAAGVGCGLADGHASLGADATVSPSRCVCDRQRSFALGIQWIVVRTLGTVH